MLVGSAVISLSIPLSILIMVAIIHRDPCYLKRYLWLFIYCFAMIVYCYSPTYENDLYKYYQEMDACVGMPFSQAFTWANDGLVVKNLLFWILGNINQKNLLQAISMGTLYGVAGYIISNSISGEHKQPFFIFVVIALIPIHLATNNIRNMLAFALSILAIYRDLKERNKNIITASLYIFPCFIHMASIVIVVGRLLIPFVKKHYKIGTILMVGVPYLTINLYPIIKNVAIPGALGLIVKRAIWKSYTTVMGTSEYAISTHDSGYNNACRIVMFLFCIVMIYVSFQHLKSISRKEESKKDFAIFHLMICIFTCVYNLTGAIKYWVFAVAAVLCSIPLLGIIMDQNSEVKVLRVKAKNFIFPLAVLRCMLELYFMMTRINFSELAYNLLTKNYITILYEVFNIFL